MRARCAAPALLHATCSSPTRARIILHLLLLLFAAPRCTPPYLTYLPRHAFYYNTTFCRAFLLVPIPTRKFHGSCYIEELMSSSCSICILLRSSISPFPPPHVEHISVSSYLFSSISAAATCSIYCPMLMRLPPQELLIARAYIYSRILALYVPASCSLVHTHISSCLHHVRTTTIPAPCRASAGRADLLSF